MRLALGASVQIDAGVDRIRAARQTLLGAAVDARSSGGTLGFGAGVARATVVCARAVGAAFVLSFARRGVIAVVSLDAPALERLRPSG